MKKKPFLKWWNSLTPEQMCEVSYMDAFTAGRRSIGQSGGKAKSIKKLKAISKNIEIARSKRWDGTTPKRTPRNK